MTKSKGRRLTTAESTLASAMYADGELLRVIAERLGVSREGIARHLAAKGEHVRFANKPLGKAKKERLITLYNRGVPVADICNSLAISETALYYTLRRQGVALRSHNRTK